MKQRLSVKILCATFAGICLVAGLAAGVNGIFNSVNATSGYKVNGAAGSSGEALCSDGTYFDTPCSTAGTGITALTGPVTASGSGSVASTITATGVTAASYLSPNVTINAAGQITAAANPTFTGTSGYQLLPSGLILEWGNTGSITNDTATSISLPHTFPNACLSVNATDSFLGGVSATWSSYSCGTTSFTARPDGNTAGANWFAIGY